jgi:manganese/zinc/iron transport system substrate-binding protein
MKLLKVLAPALLLALFVGGCKVENGGDPANRTYSGQGPIQVVTTIGMVADIVQNVGGERVKTTALMGAGVDPHLYKATPGDIGKLTRADMVFYSGLHLEGKMADILEKMNSQKPSVAVAEGIPKTQLLLADSTTQHPDPHLWFDVKKWMTATEAARDALIKFDPPNAELYRKNTAAYLEKLRQLDDYARTELAKIPKDRRVLVTAHDAFNYFGKAYGVEVMGLQGLSTASEVSLRDVQRIVEVLSSRKIKAVFVESSVPKRSIEAVVQGSRAKGHNVQLAANCFPMRWVVLARPKALISAWCATTSIPSLKH